MPTQKSSGHMKNVCVSLRRDLRTGNIIVLAPDHEEINGKPLDQVWDEGWRPREYDQGRVVLARSEEPSAT